VDETALDATLVADTPGGARDGGVVAPGEAIGRYVVEREHARGGMGVVAIAYDPELGRNVALKVLRPHMAAHLPELLRDEARAMAKLSHPNVVSVYDVGEDGGRIFIAMELVEGLTLREWLGQEPRDWRAIVRALVRAGRGLAAAHRANLVHRDFKPDNVLCGPDDRMRVTDFGLARAGAVTDDAPRTAVGTSIVGTPVYMAPEVWRGEPATARSDQWSFCVTLYEALYRAPPFSGETEGELRAAIDRGMPAPPRRPRVPARILRAIARGLTHDPEARFATVDDLIAELDAVLRRPRPIVIAASAAAAAALAGVAFVGLRGERVDPCQIPPSLIESAWSSARGDAVTAAFTASGRKHAPESARRVRRLLDDYSKHWLDARTDACVATRVRGDQSAAVLDLRARCLDRRRDELAELARVLTDKPTGDVVDHALEAALSLHQLDACTATGVQTEVPLPNDPVRAAQITALDKELARARAALLVQRVDAATAQARGILARAKPLGYPPLTARALRLLAKLAKYSSDHAEAERLMNEAIAAAAAAHDDRAAADIWIELIAFTATQKGDGAAAIELAKPAEAALLRADSPRDLRAAFQHALGTAYSMQGKYSESREAYQKALRDAPSTLQTAQTEAALCGVELKLAHIKEGAALCERGIAALEAELGPQHPLVGFALVNFGNVGLQTFDHAAARTAIERALVILADTVGEKHMVYAGALNNLGTIAARTGDYATARSAFERSLASFGAAHHAGAFSPLANLGNLERDLGHAAEARKAWERALALAEATQGPESGRAAQAHASLGNLEFDAGNLDKATARYERALAITTKVYGENHTQTAEVLDSLANVYDARNDCKRVISYETRAIAVNEAIYGPAHPKVAQTLTAFARCQSELGNADSIANLERALAIYDRHPDIDPFDRAFTCWVLASALRHHHLQPARAIALAKEARALYAKSPVPEAAKELPAIDRFLRANGR